MSSDGSDPVDIRVGGDFAVRAEGPAADLDQLRIARDGDTLRIGMKKGVHWGNRRNVRVLVTLPRLSEAGVAGSGSMRIDRVEGNSFKGGIAGSGNLTIGAMRVGQAKLGVAGSGSVNASGAVDTLKIGIAGSGNVLANGLHAKRADVGIAGSGRVAVQVDGPTKVSLSGSGDADLGPNRSARCARQARARHGAVVSSNAGRLRRRRGGARMTAMPIRTAFAVLLSLLVAVSASAAERRVDLSSFDTLRVEGRSALPSPPRHRHARCCPAMTRPCAGSRRR